MCERASERVRVANAKFHATQAYLLRVRAFKCMPYIRCSSPAEQPGLRVQD